MTKPRKTRILFDGQCIVCDTEVAYYKRIAPETFELTDITDPTFDASLWGLTPEAVNLHMHVISPNGQIHKGVDAFQFIWSQIPNRPALRLASHVITWPGIYQAATLAYSGFARIRRFLPKKN